MNGFTHLSLTSTASGRGADFLVFVVVSRGVHMQVLEYQYVHAFQANDTGGVSTEGSGTASERHWRCQHGGLRDSARGAEPRGHRTKGKKTGGLSFLRP